MQRYALNRVFRKERISFQRKRVLDIGCGRGRWLFFYEKNHKAIVRGIDLSKDAVQVCESKGFKVCQGSITELPFQDSCFDFVNSTTVLLHLPYKVKETAISEISRILKPGGKAILIESTWKDPSLHVFGLSVTEWEDHFNKCGLNLIHKSGHCFNLFRMKLPSYLPFRDLFAIYLDYLLEIGLMSYFYGKQSQKALQHLMVFEK
jgi:ubiquinone/menaquinone biosynthesis C-methylase UbiE